ncbi:tonsoku-like protein [Condylostylus longicornis]|uniref:tonsoku-like protein n=1 Tax=Condylostylus longicornis TaxID=2530218 RepID=UPI00244E356D|nr:tonsoku-like protein [Condylostylus longicornis]
MQICFEIEDSTLGQMEYEERKLQKRKEKALNECNRQSIAEACNNLGDFYNQSGRYLEAAKEYEEEALLYEKLGTNFVLPKSKAHRMVGEMFMLLSEFENALKYVNLYLKQVQNLCNKIEEQRAYATLGRVYLLYGQSSGEATTASKQLKNAEKAFIKSLLITKDLTGSVNKFELLDMQARLYLNIGVVKEHMGEFEEAVEYKEKAVKIAKANDMFELLHLCYISISLLYQIKKNDCAIALRFCNLALEVAERLPEKTKKVCETLLTKAEILIKQGDFQSAKRVLVKAYKLRTSDLNDRQNIERNLKIVAAICYALHSLIETKMEDYDTRKRLYEKIGDGSCSLQNYEKAIEYYLQALDAARKNGDTIKQLIPIYISLYQTYKDNKEYEKSLEFLWKEFEANKNIPEEAVTTLFNIGEVCEIQMKPFWTVYEIYQKACNESKKINQSNKLLKIALVRQFKLAIKYNMTSVADDIKEEALKENINIEDIENDLDDDSEELLSDENTPDIGEDICLENLTDSDNECEELQTLRPVRKARTSLTIKRNNKGETQLHQACISGNLNLARRLIDQGHAINVRDHAGWLPLHEACNHGFRDIVELLLDKGGTSSINDNGGTSCDGITPLHDACCNGYLDVAELLLERGANPTLKTDFGDTALNMLDKWRNSVDLDYDEQTRYEIVRSKIASQLNKIGEKVTSPPLTNSSKAIDNSIGKVRQPKRNKSDINLYTQSNSSSKRNLGTPALQLEDEFYESESDYELPANILKEDSRNTTNFDKKLTARNEYKSAIQNLKHPNRLVTILPETFEIMKNEAQKKRGAFLDEDEVDDDWLDNDVGSHKKRHKCDSDNKIYATHPNTLKRDTSSSRHSGDYLTVPTSQYSIENSDSSDAESVGKQNAFTVLLDPKNKSNKQGKKMRRTLSMNSNSSRRSSTGNCQSSLLDKGFCRFGSNNALINEDSSNRLIEIEPDSTTTVYESPRKKEITIIKLSPQKVNSIISFKIKVENELLLVPVERKKTGELSIKWLAEEASRRYYNLVGIRPVLRLMTPDGFGFEESDSINIAIEENMISSKVLDWKISPLPERYEEMCHQLNQVTDEFTKSTLEKSHISNILSLANLSLTPLSTEPIFKALLHQSTLRVLDLSNNFIQNEGCKQLGKSLITLKQLKTLNLEGNCITSDGLMYFIKTDCVHSQEQQFSELETLNLSFNPLGDRSLEHLEMLCKMCKKLNSLSLQSCSLTNFYEYNLSFEKLIDFNISFNELTTESMNRLLKGLNSSLIQKLLLNFTNHKNKEFGTNFYIFLESGTCEKIKNVELANCNLTDSDVYKIVKLLNKCKYLELINLSNNNKLTGASFKYIIENLGNVHKIILEECPHIVEISKLQNLNLNNFPDFLSLTLNETSTIDIETLCSKIEFLKNFWYNCYGDKGKVFHKGNYFCLYINEKDLIL